MIKICFPLSLMKTIPCFHTAICAEWNDSERQSSNNTLAWTVSLLRHVLLPGLQMNATEMKLQKRVQCLNISSSNFSKQMHLQAALVRCFFLLSLDLPPRTCETAPSNEMRNLGLGTLAVWCEWLVSMILKVSSSWAVLWNGWYLIYMDPKCRQSSSK